MKNLVNNKVSDEDLESAKINRDSALNPPNIPPGMDDDDDWGDDWGDFGSSSDLGDSKGFDGFGDSSGFGSSGFGSSGFGDSGFGGGGFGGGNLGGGGWNGGGFGQGQQQPMPQHENPEDKFWNTIAKGGKSGYNFVSDLVKSFKKFNAIKQKDWGRNVIVTSGILIVIAIISKLFGANGVLQVIIGSLIASGIAIPVFMKAMEDIQEGRVSFNDEPEPEIEMDFHNDFDETEDEDFDDVFRGEIDSDEESLFSNLDVDEPLFASAYDDIESEPEVVYEKANPTEILDKLNSNMGMVTRQYLYELVNSCLVNKTKDFGRVHNLPEDSREFLAYSYILEQAAEILKTGNQESMPQLLSVRDKLFYVQLEISRVKWLKNLNNLIEEIVNICRYDEETGKIDENIFGYGHTVGDKMFIKIMKGETAMVTIKDAYGKISQDILDTKNFLPVILGIDEEGDVVWTDMKKINSLLVTGMPRSGKSWFVKAVLGQMMMYLKPSELNFYLLDPKGDISDFKSLNVPHIKRFVSSDEEIVQTLRWVVKTEADRRRKLMHEAGGFIDYWDLKKKRPDIDLPLLYVVIDEVVTLSDRMDKETKAEFQALLSQLVSQLPALGIRIFMIPHVVKDQVLKKTITDLIPCRISVMGDAGHIENVTGASAKTFVHKLVNQGDMAVRLNNNKIQFVHGIIIADTNEGTDEFFDFLTSMWLKIAPESYEGSKKAKEEGKSKRINNVSSKEITQSSVDNKPKRSNSRSTKKEEIQIISDDGDETDDEFEYDGDDLLDIDNELNLWGDDE